MVKMKIFLSLLIVSMIFFSCCYDTTSEEIVYSGKILNTYSSVIDTTISIYITNLDYALTNSYKKSMLPWHPINNGNFRATQHTVSHCINEKVEHWQCGPLRILIEHPDYVTYFDSLSNDELKTLKKNSAGEWVLPEITIQRK